MPSRRFGRPGAGTLDMVLPSELRECLHREICAFARATGSHRPRKSCLRHWRSTEELNKEAHHHKTNHKVAQKLHQGWVLPLLRSIMPPKPSGIRQVITATGDRLNLMAKRNGIRLF